MAWLQKRGGVWWIGWRHDGRLVRKSLRTSDRALAKAELDRINSIAVTSNSNAVTADYIEAMTGKAPAKKPTLAEFPAIHGPKFLANKGLNVVGF
jgi:hypothetical protein